MIKPQLGKIYKYGREMYFVYCKVSNATDTYGKNTIFYHCLRWQKSKDYELDFVANISFDGDKLCRMEDVPEKIMNDFENPFVWLDFEKWCSDLNTGNNRRLYGF